MELSSHDEQRNQTHHPFRHLTPALPHDIDDRLQIRSIFFCEKGDRLALASSTTRTTDPVNVTLHRLRKIVVDDQIDSLEIDTARHELGTNENPKFARPEFFHGPVTLRFRSLRVHHVDVDPLEYKLVEKFPRTLDGLNKDKDRWSKTFPDHTADFEEFAFFRADKEEFLVDRVSCGIPGGADEHRYK